MLEQLTWVLREGSFPLWQGSFLLTLHLIAEETKVPRCWFFSQLN